MTFAGCRIGRCARTAASAAHCAAAVIGRAAAEVVSGPADAVGPVVEAATRELRVLGMLDAAPGRAALTFARVLDAPDISPGALAAAGRELRAFLDMARRESRAVESWDELDELKARVARKRVEAVTNPDRTG